ncbi:MAG TPA: clostripain-related cysteine peptidase, partial [Lachnospiraceae bacterium]|nr:clostripain-related cysteine peptidase [Lachnospiraceae bacterium]
DYRYETDAEIVEPLDITGMAEAERTDLPLEKKRTTFLIYMNGSDLESDGEGSASDDINEMQEALTVSDDINIILLTGGTLNWQRPEIPNGTYRIYELQKEGLNFVCDMGSQNIGDPALLAGFINLGLTCFPAEKTGVILWNHGGGSIYGYGDDEITGDSLLLTELNSAFASSEAAVKTLDFVGFDACLMGNLETACMLSPYADYMVASEEFEPGEGWDYSFIGEFDQETEQGTPEECRNIVDSYVKGLNTKTDDWLDTQATLSVINLKTVGYLTDAFDDFSEETSLHMLVGNYNEVARARDQVKSFGASGESDDCYDMVDIDSLAMEFQEISPEKSTALTDALRETVVYSSHNANIDRACGLSVYFPYKSKSDVPEALETYEAMDILPAYTKFMSRFSEKLLNESFDFSSFAAETPVQDEDGNFTAQLTEEELDSACNVYFTLWEQEEELEPGIYYYIELAETADLTVFDDGTVTTQFDGMWTTLNDNWVCMYEIDRTDTQIRYAIPAYINEQDMDIIVVYDEQNPEGKVVGARPGSESETNMASRQMTEISPGDEITLYYWAELFLDEGTDEELAENYEEGCWYSGEPWTVPDEGLVLARYELEEDEYLYSFALYDTANEVHYTEFMEIE